MAEIAPRKRAIADRLLELLGLGEAARAHTIEDRLTVERHDAWGRRKLAYPIAKKEEGVYHLVAFAAEAETLDELSRVLKIDDDVLRHLATRRPEGGPGEPIAVGAPIGDDAATPTDVPEEE